MKAPAIRYAKSGDVSIAYGVVGDGPFDIVFIGGWVLTVFDTAWEGPAAETLAALARFSRLILFDKRGTGMSDRDAGVPDLATRMDDIRAVMDAAGSERAAIVGVSEGGPMALLFAATYPERTAALVLYGTGASFVRAADYPWAPTFEERDAFVAGDTDPPVGSDEWVDDALRALAPSMADDEDGRRWWRRWVQASASPGTVRALRQMNRGLDVRYVLPAVTAPTLVLHPAEDEEYVLDEGRYIADRIPGADLVELPGADHGWWVRGDQIGREVERFLGELWERGEWDTVEPDRVVATVLFTDIVDSTATLAEVGDKRWRSMLDEHNAIIRRLLVRYHGKEISTAGDGFFASFDGPARAIRCACAISRSLEELGLEVRAGLHTGECEVVGDDLAGIAVHIGARVAARAAPGQVLVSGTVKDLVAGSGIAFEDGGTAELKGIPGEWRLYAVAEQVATA